MAKKKKVDYAYLESVSIEGFRNLKKTKVDFVPGLNIIIGQNGVGKSNLLRILYDFFCDGEASNLGDKLEAKIAFLNVFFSISFEKISSFEIQQRSLDELSRDPTINNYKLYKGKKLVIDSSSKNHREFAFIYLIKQGYFSRYVFFNLPKDCFFLLEPSNFQLEIIKNNESKNLEYVHNRMDNSERSFLKYLIRGRKQYLEEVTYSEIINKEIKLDSILLSNLLQFSPIKDVRLSDFTIQKHDNIIKVGNIYFEFLIDNEWISWSFLSDGTKRLFYLIHEVTKAHSNVLIEEPELGVHPHQFHSIMLFLKEQSKEKQIILTTHSPYALNVLGKEDLDSIIIAKLDKNNGSVFSHLSENQKAKAARYMSDVAFLSDYWMHSNLEENED